MCVYTHFCVSVRLRCNSSSHISPSHQTELSNPFLTPCQPPQPGSIECFGNAAPQHPCGNYSTPHYAKQMARGGLGEGPFDEARLPEELTPALAVGSSTAQAFGRVGLLAGWGLVDVWKLPVTFPRPIFPERPDLLSPPKMFQRAGSLREHSTICKHN